jgi:CBS domain-containing protein
MYEAHDVMNTRVVTIPADATVEKAIATLVENDISGAPVVDRAGCLIGIISEYRLLEAVYSPEIKNDQVSGLMSTEVLTVDENALLSDITSLFIAKRIRRVPVVRNGQLMGIISRRDLLRYTLEAKDTVDPYLQRVGEDGSLAVHGQRRPD